MRQRGVRARLRNNERTFQTRSKKEETSGGEEDGMGRKWAYSVLSRVLLRDLPKKGARHVHHSSFSSFSLSFSRFALRK